MANWEDSRNPASFIKRMEATRSVKDDGQVQFSGMDIMTVPAKLENIVKLNSLVTQEDKHIIVWSAIRNAGKKGVLSSDSVIEEIGTLEKEYLSKREQKFVLVSTLSINPLKHKLPNLQIDRSRITFSPKIAKRFIKHIMEDQNTQWLPCKNKIPNNYTWAMVTVSAKSIHHATQEALRALNLFRGELNYLINYGKRTFSFGCTPKPINKILYGPIHTLHKPDGGLVDEVYWQVEDCFELVKTYRNNTTGRFEKIMNSLSVFRKQLSKSKIKDILENAILLYNAALDSYSFDTAFIKLWATLELLTGTGRDSYDITVNRTAFIFKNVEAIKVHLNILKDCRNNIVHKGYMEGQKDILLYDLKLYVEQLINFLLCNVQGLKNFGEIKQLLDSCSDKSGLVQSKKVLENKVRINKLAQKLHK